MCVCVFGRWYCFNIAQLHSSYMHIAYSQRTTQTKPMRSPVLPPFVATTTTTIAFIFFRLSICFASIHLRCFVQNLLCDWWVVMPPTIYVYKDFVPTMATSNVMSDSVFVCVFMYLCFERFCGWLLTAYMHCICTNSYPIDFPFVHRKDVCRSGHVVNDRKLMKVFRRNIYHKTSNINILPH